jgi:hypothetical protein
MVAVLRIDKRLGVNSLVTAADRLINRKAKEPHFEVDFAS